jgi:hypothetical protein
MSDRSLVMTETKRDKLVLQVGFGRGAETKINKKMCSIEELLRRG